MGVEKAKKNRMERATVRKTIRTEGARQYVIVLQ